ncbi:MAG: hypothetical protein JWR61_2925 [Ferruginibacter sp.]|uniref:hypothetical protein n=1 Tax=Ferruginibacter sp. TaxID=1940288 RepID=UPI00265B1779|nr:hypothetical protein [Ferruginibacter sp.]MDB5277970.1 hypothetical protein [Ferruginibacter sp.]
MKTIPGLLLVILLMMACSNGTTETASDKENYKKATETLLEKEKKNPITFLKVYSHDKHNLLGQTVIKGNIDNSAKVCSYKDVQLELSFFSKTGTLLEKDNETIYDVIAPGKSVDFKTKYFAPKGTDSVAIKIVSAKINQ